MDSKDNFDDILEEASQVLEQSSQRINNSQYDNSQIRDNLLIKCRDAIESLQIEINEERNLRREAEAKIIELENANDDLQADNRALLREMESLNYELEQLRAEPLLYGSSSHINLHQDITDLEDQLAQKEEELKKSFSKIKTLETTLNQVEEENEILRVELQNFDERPDTWRTEDRGRNELDYTFKQQKQELETSFQMKEQQMRTDLLTAVDMVEKDAERKAKLYEDIKHENALLRDELKMLREHYEARQKQQDMKHIEKMQQALERKALELQNDFQQQKYHLISENEALKYELNWIQKDINDYQSKSDRYDDALKEARQERKALNDTISEMQQIIDSQSEQLAERNITGARQHNDDLQEMQKELQELRFRLTSELQNEMRKRLSEKEAYRDALQQAKSAFREKLQSKDQQLQFYKSQLESVQKPPETEKATQDDSFEFSREIVLKTTHQIAELTTELRRERERRIESERRQQELKNKLFSSQHSSDALENLQSELTYLIHWRNSVSNSPISEALENVIHRLKTKVIGLI